jgi:hypothetical protein
MSVTCLRVPVPLCVPYWDERAALEAGAQYNAADGFFAPAGAPLDPLWQWLPQMYSPFVPRPVLVPEMLPVTTWEQNVRHKLGEDVWDRMRKHAYKAAGYRCEICAAKGKLEAHESWSLSNEDMVQKLEKLLCLCPLCHKAKHIGIARRLGMYDEVMRHLKRVNGWSDAQLSAALDDVKETHEQRCDWPWTVDLSWLYESGYLYV